MSIPQPPTRPFVGNVPDISLDNPIQGMWKLAREYGPIYRLELPTESLLIVSSQAIAADACDTQRFDKFVHTPLRNVRSFAGDGLFTAYTDEPNWGKAHRLLMPAFGPGAMRNYFDDMVDIADQMLTKWARLGAEQPIDVADNMTRLTLDTIALCGFGYRFNSYYQRELHPFVDAMVGALEEASARARRLPLQTKLMLRKQRKYQADHQTMEDVTQELIAARRALPPDEAPRDLLGLMLTAKDRVTGEGLDDQNIRYQMATFLIAGHETTSGLLSFAIYELLKHPHILAKARQLVDDVLGSETPRFEQLEQLGYLDQVLRETLRLFPTAPAFGVVAKADTLLAGQYPLAKGDKLLLLLPALHRDPAVWADAELFDPERFSPEREKNIPPHAWLPFGNGPRACIGRAFAMQEAVLVLAMTLQRFELAEAAPYTLKIKETLTLKPDGYLITARARQAVSRRATVAAAQPPAPPTPGHPTHGTPLLILFGSNSGASEAFARRLVTEGAERGYNVQLAPLDDHVDRLPTQGATLIITSSYSGKAPDNAVLFTQWLAEAPAGSLGGVRFAVFGCGNRAWAKTYQAIPTLIDSQLQAAGAKPLLARGEADARGDFFGDFERWVTPLWATLEKTVPAAAAAPPGCPYHQPA